MVVKNGRDAESNSQKMGDSSVEHDNGNSLTTSVFISDTHTTVKLRRPEFNYFNNNTESKLDSKSEYSTPKYSDEIQSSHTIPAYANISYFSVHNEGNAMTDYDRPTVVVRRTGSFESTEGKNSPRNSTKNESEYECMSSPESFSNSSSNRSSNTSSFYGNISPDTISLASFAGRLNFGRFSTCSKRSSQSSNASSQDSGRQSWDKIRDSFDLSDGVISSARRPSGEHIYENTRPLTPDNSMRFSRVEGNHMGVMDQAANDLPPPLPTRQQQQPISVPPKEEPEMILPYKVVDLDELQRSLEDIKPYYVHNGLEDGDSEFFNNKSDPIKMDFGKDGESAKSSDFRPVLPPKKRPLSHSKSDTTFNATEFKERPTPLPRQSLICDLPQAQDSTVQGKQIDESNNLTELSMSDSGHVSRRKSPQSEPGSKLRQTSMSPERNTRPPRSAPPPPQYRSHSTGERVPSNRPVSELFPRNRSNNSPTALKRSLTVSLLQSPFVRRPVNSFCEEKTGNENSVQNLSTAQKVSSGEQYDEKNREDTKKALKTGKFFKKALSNLKIPGTKKAAKKELTISPPSDFTSLYETGLTGDYSNRGQKTVSFLARDDNCGELADSKASAVMCESSTQEDKPNNDDCELTTEDTDKPMEQLSFHPEFTKFPIIDVNEPVEQFYYNFPISQTVVNGTEKLATPKKPPRSAYLQPSLSQLTKEREEEIDLKKLPELGPLPPSPEGSLCQGTPKTPESIAPTFSTVDKISDCTTTEDHIYSLTTPDSDDQKENDAKSDKPQRKPKPQVPRRPSTLKFKPKVPNRPVLQSSDKPVPIPRSLTLDTATIQKSQKESVPRTNVPVRRHSTSLEESAGISRSCDSLHYDAPTDTYVTDMHLTVLKDILRCWRNMLCKPTISLAGACWEDFEIIESESQPEVCENQDSVSLQVRLRKESTNLDSKNRCGQYIAKIKCKTQGNGNGNTKSPFDQDYSVSTSLEPHENVSRVLAYFRGEIQSSILGMGDDTSPLHTTISISDQVPMQTCAEFIVQSMHAHSGCTSYEKVVCMLMLQCLKGVMHLHDSGFTHGNLNLNNLFLIKHDRDFQLLIGNFGNSQPLPKERRATALYSKIDDSPMELSNDQNDFIAISEIFTTMLYHDQNGNGTHASESSCSTLSKHLRRASERLRDRSVSTHQVVCLLQALLWGPFELGENIVIVSENKMSQWLTRQRSEFIARLAMEEALARTVGENSRKFSMEDLLLCDYLTTATSSSLARTEKCWLLPT